MGGRAQSGRNLRLGLAKKAAELQLGGLLPPQIVMPSQLLVPADARVATEAEEMAVTASLLLECDVGKYHALFPTPLRRFRPRLRRRSERSAGQRARRDLQDGRSCPQVVRDSVFGKSPLAAKTWYNSRHS